MEPWRPRRPAGCTDDASLIASGATTCAVSARALERARDRIGGEEERRGTTSPSAASRGNVRSELAKFVELNLYVYDFAPTGTAKGHRATNLNVACAPNCRVSDSPNLAGENVG